MVASLIARSCRWGLLSVLLPQLLIASSVHAFSACRSHCSHLQQLPSNPSRTSASCRNMYPIDYMYKHKGDDDNILNDDAATAPYVPSGLTLEEYTHIRQAEAAKISKLEYAAWGPRFRRSSAPRGDWMALPQLWTKGYQPSSNADLKSGGGDTTSQLAVATSLPSSRTGRMGRRIRHKLPYVALSYLSVDMILAVVSSRQGLSGMSPPEALIKPIYSFCRHNLHPSLSLWYVSAAKVGLALAGSRPAERFVDWARGKRRWTPRRVLTVSAVSVVLGACVSSALVNLITTFIRYLWLIKAVMYVF
jgi:hypothetical protein